MARARCGAALLLAAVALLLLGGVAGKRGRPAGALARLGSGCPQMLGFQRQGSRPLPALARA